MRFTYVCKNRQTRGNNKKVTTTISPISTSIDSTNKSSQLNYNA